MSTDTAIETEIMVGVNDEHPFPVVMVTLAGSY